MKIPTIARSFNQNLETLTDRFPVFSLFLSELDPSNYQEKYKTDIEIDLQDVQILYVCGIDPEIYFQVKPWLDSSRAHQLVFLDNDLSRICSALHTETDLFENQRVHVEWLQEGEIKETTMMLAERFANSKISVVLHPEVNIESFEELKKELLEHSTLFEAVLCDNIFSDQLFGNFFQNLNNLSGSFSVQDLKGKFSGVPAIICGAGPSLEKSIPFLKKLEDRALILAGGSAITALSRNHVSFHFGTVCDPNFEEVKRVERSFAFEVPLLYSLRVHPKIFEKRNGLSGVIHAGSGGVFEDWLAKKCGFTGQKVSEKLSDQALSVTALNVALAEFLGCNPIIFCGLDLAYTNGEFYSKGVLSVIQKAGRAQAQIRAPLAKVEPLLKKTLDKFMQKRLVFSQKKPVSLESLSSRDIQVHSEPPREKKLRLKRLDIFQRPIETTTIWAMESNVIAEFAKNHPDTTFINATEGGLGFDGIENESLGSVSHRLLKKQMDIHSLVHSHCVSSEHPQLEMQLKKLMGQTRRGLKTCQEKVQIILKELSSTKCQGQESGAYILAKMELEEEDIYRDLFVLFRYHARKFLQYHLGIDEGKSSQDLEKEVWSQLSKTLDNYLKLYS